MMADEAEASPWIQDLFPIQLQLVKPGVVGQEARESARTATVTGEVFFFSMRKREVVVSSSNLARAF